MVPGLSELNYNLADKIGPYTHHLAPSRFLVQCRYCANESDETEHECRCYCSSSQLPRLLFCPTIGAILSARSSAPKLANYVRYLPNHPAAGAAAGRQVAPGISRAIKVAAGIEDHLAVRIPTVAAVKVVQIDGCTVLIAIWRYLKHPAVTTRAPNFAHSVQFVVRPHSHPGKRRASVSSYTRKRVNQREIPSV